MKINKLILVSLLLISTITFFSCEDDIVKDDYEITDTSKLPTLAASVGDVTYESATATGTYTMNGDTIIEKGFLISTDESFATIESAITIAGETYSSSFEVLGETTYYLKAYTISANGTATSEVVSFTTPVAPTFEDTYLYGTYTESDYDLDGVLEASYPSGIQFTEKPGSANQFYITNLWDGGKTIVASVDFENKTIAIAAQVIYVSGDYGDCSIIALIDSGAGLEGDPTASVIGSYDEQGNVTLAPWGANVSAGWFGKYSKSTFTKVSD